MRTPAILSFVLLLAACGTPASGDLCSRSFEPYPDLVSGRVRTAQNGPYLDAMAHYAKGDYAAAAEGLRVYLESPGRDKRAHLYLAVSLLASGKPHEAELNLDQLKTGHTPGYKDALEWYAVLCWLCGEQDQRALQGAMRIAQGPHTYREQAKKLVAELEKRAR